MPELLNSAFPVKIFDGKEYYEVCSSKDLHEKVGKRIVIDQFAELEAAIFKVGGELYAVSNICPHQHSDQIYKGIIEGLNLVCPLHGWTFSLETGKNINKFQGLKGLKKYFVLEKDGKIYFEKVEVEKPLWSKLL